MQATLDIDEELLAAARTLAGQRDVSLDTVVNDLLRTAIRPRIIDDPQLGFPVFAVPDGTPPIDPERIRAALDEGI